MTDLTEFLLARIDDDEAAARECAEVYPPPWEVNDRGHSANVRADAPNFWLVSELEQARPGGPDLGWLGDRLAHIARHDPTRVLAECAAKRRIVALHNPAGLIRPCPALAILAAVYDSHPDYDERWRP